MVGLNVKHLIEPFFQRKRFIRSSIYIFLYNVLTFIATFFIARTYTNWFSPEAYSILGKFMFIVLLAPNVFTMWIIAALVRYIPEKIAQGKPPAPLVSFVLKNLLISLFVYIMLLLIFSSYIKQYIGSSLPVLLFCLPVVTSLFLFIVNILQSLQLFGIMSLFQSIKRILYLLAAIIVVFVMRADDISIVIDLYTLIELLMVVTMLISLFLLQEVRKNFSLVDPGLNRDEKIDILRFSAPYFLSGIAIYITGWMDFFIISLVGNSQDTGVYYLATQIANIISTLVIIPVSVISPQLIQYLSQNNHQIIREYKDKFIPVMQILWTIFIILCLLLSEFIITKLMSDKFSGAVQFLRLLLVGYSVVMLSFAMNPVIQFYKRSGKLVGAKLLQAVLGIFLAFIFIKSVGITGVCLAKSISVMIYPVIIFILIPECRSFFNRVAVISAMIVPVGFIVYFISKL